MVKRLFSVLIFLPVYVLLGQEAQTNSYTKVEWQAAKYIIAAEKKLASDIENVRLLVIQAKSGREYASNGYKIVFKNGQYAFYSNSKTPQTSYKSNFIHDLNEYGQELFNTLKEYQSGNALTKAGFVQNLNATNLFIGCTGRLPMLYVTDMKEGECNYVSCRIPTGVKHPHVGWIDMPKTDKEHGLLIKDDIYVGHGNKQKKMAVMAIVNPILPPPDVPPKARENVLYCVVGFKDVMVFDGTKKVPILQMVDPSKLDAAIKQLKK